MQGNSTGSNNTCIGFGAMQNSSTGSQNSIIGSNSGGSISTGSFNTCIGYNSSADNYSYSTALGQSATNTANRQIMLGTVNETVVVPGHK